MQWTPGSYSIKSEMIHEIYIMNKCDFLKPMVPYEII